MTNIANLLTEHMAIWTAADTEKKSGRGRASANAGSVYGVKKLRELILELAVRGKLVSQDPNDESASQLLKRIQAEKAKLIAEGKLKKEKLLAPISEDEKPFELPRGWEWVHLPDVTDYKVGKTPATKSSIYWTNDSNGYNWVSIADLNHDGVVTETSKRVTHEALKDVFKAEPVAVGTILMSFKLTLGKISILEVPAFHNEAIISIYPSPAIDKKYLFKILPARANEGDSKSAIKGNTLNSESIAALLLPLPPLDEQHRIVAKVDELMALCDQLEQQHSNAQEAHETLVSQLLATLTQSQNAAEFNANWQRIYAHFDELFTTEASIDALKQTLLQLAVMGKLTHSVPIESNVEIGRLFTLIDGDRGHNYPKSHDYMHEGYCLFLSTKNVRKNGFLFEEMQYISKEKHTQLRQGLMTRGDIVITTRGTLGNVAVYDDHVPYDVMRINSGMLILRPKSSDISADFLMTFIQSPVFDSQLQEMRTGSAQPQIPAGILKLFVMPLYTISEQHRIVAKVDALMSLCDQLKTRIQQANQQQQTIADALVEQAAA